MSAPVRIPLRVAYVAGEFRVYGEVAEVEAEREEDRFPAPPLLAAADSRLLGFEAASAAMQAAALLLGGEP